MYTQTLIIASNERIDQLTNLLFENKKCFYKEKYRLSAFVFS